MSSSIGLPLQFHLWPLRLAKQPAVLQLLQAQPLVFARFYWLTKDVLMTHSYFREQIESVSASEEDSLEADFRLIKQLGLGAKETSLPKVRGLKEGILLHEKWFSEQGPKVVKALEKVESLLLDGVEVLENRGEPPMGARVSEFFEAMGLSPLEKEFFGVLLSVSLADDFMEFLQSLSPVYESRPSELWTSLLRCEKSELVHLLRETGPLLRSGVIARSDFTSRGLAKLNNTWLELLVGDYGSLLEALAVPAAVSQGEGLPSRLSSDDMVLASSLLDAKTDVEGVNLLLYGGPGQDRNAVIQRLLAVSGREGWTVRKDLQLSQVSAIFVVGELLRKRQLQTGVLSAVVVPSSSKVFSGTENKWAQLLFGLPPSDEELSSADAQLLTSNKVPGLWLETDPANLSRKVAAHFMLHLPLLAGKKQDRQLLVREALAGLGLPADLEAKAVALSGVSALQVQNAWRAASALAQAEGRPAAFMSALSRSAMALSKQKAKRKECVTAYSLDMVNCAGRFGPKQILKAFKARPKGALCLYGPPGTGKTQFVDYLADALDLPLISKKASDLLGKYVGENEQNIAKAFEDASAEEAILFLDEGDSFLRDRSSAHSSWEVSTVNELLQNMEQFQGIFILATNLQRGLDAAALRRFTFKLEFLPSTPEQRWTMFLNETGLAEESLSEKQVEQWKDDLLMMVGLTPGDFATVKRQCILLGETLSPQEWLIQLQMECEARKALNRAEQERGTRLA